MPADLPNPAAPDWRELYPFKPHFAELSGGARCHFVDEGKDTGAGPLLMLHGNPTWSFFYRHLITGMLPNNRVVAPDHIGCGLSDKPQDYPYTLERHIANLEELAVSRLDLRNLTLVLHDWGGAIGMGLAVRHPERIRRLVILNTAAFLLPNCPWRIRACRIPGFGPMAVRGANLFARAALHMAIARRERLTQAIRAGYLAPYDSYANRIATLEFVRDIPLAKSHPSWQTVTNIQKKLHTLADRPTMICWGDRDFCFTEAFLKVWQSYFPGAKVHRFADAGHYLLEDAHERILPLLREFHQA